MYIITRLFFYLEPGHGVGAHGAHGSHGAQLIFLGPMGPTGPSSSIVFTLPNGFVKTFLVPENSASDYHTGYGDPRRYLEILSITLRGPISYVGMIMFVYQCFLPEKNKLSLEKIIPKNIFGIAHFFSIQ